MKSLLAAAAAPAPAAPTSRSSLRRDRPAPATPAALSAATSASCLAAVLLLFLREDLIGAILRGLELGVEILGLRVHLRGLSGACGTDASKLIAAIASSSCASCG